MLEPSQASCDSAVTAGWRLALRLVGDVPRWGEGSACSGWSGGMASKGAVGRVGDVMPMVG